MNIQQYQTDRKCRRLSWQTVAQAQQYGWKRKIVDLSKLSKIQKQFILDFNIYNYWQMLIQKYQFKSPKPMTVQLIMYKDLQYYFRVYFGNPMDVYIDTFSGFQASTTLTHKYMHNNLSKLENIKKRQMILKIYNQFISQNKRGE